MRAQPCGVWSILTRLARGEAHYLSYRVAKAPGTISCEPLMTTKLEVEKGQVRELERRLADAVKVLPFVPAGEFKKAKAQLDQIKDAIGILRASADTRREN